MPRENIFEVSERMLADGSVRTPLDEQEARDQLLKNWVAYPPSDRALCMRAADYLPSYVEWITCAEMSKDLRRIRNEKPTPRAPD